MNELDKENLHKEIDLIQACITRMANNSFLLKGWAISIIAVVLALSSEKLNPLFLCLILLVPLLSFWYLDAFFLYTEKLYRKMYEWVIKERPKSNSEFMYNLNPHRFKEDLKVRKHNKKTKKMENTDKIENEWTVMWSVTLRWFYGIPVALVLIIICVLCVTNLNKTEELENAPRKDENKEYIQKKIAPSTEEKVLQNELTLKSQKAVSIKSSNKKKRK